MIFNELLQQLNATITFYLVFPAILFLGGYLSWRLRFVQLAKLKMSFTQLFSKTEGGAKGNISHYQAVSAVLAGNLGTGNISGMAVAIATGGPGALVWMWVMAFFGMVIQYANCLLGVKYRSKRESGEYVGGPMYYLRDGLGLNFLAVLFSIFLIFGAFSVGNLAQVNSMVLPLKEFGVPPLLVGGVMAGCIALVILGGMRRVALVSAAVVPFMAIIYLLTALTILGMHADAILPALSRMLHSALGGSAAVGGVAGFTVMKALTSGFDRAIFATDAGTGIVPILQAGAKTKHPVVDGVVALVSPFIVTIVCTITGLVLMVTGASDQSGLISTDMVAYAFGQGIGKTLGPLFVAAALVLFGYTTALAWATCLERAVGFLMGPSLIRPFLLLYICMVPVGALLRVDLVWMLADLSLSFMLLINLIGVAGLSHQVIGESRAFFLKSYQ